MTGTFFRVSSGLPTAEHRRRMGADVWIFLWYLDRQTGGHGWVLKSRRKAKGREITDAEIGQALDLHPKSVAASRRRLEAEGYIETERGPRGYRVRIVRQKKFRQSDDRWSGNTPSGSISDGAETLHHRGSGNTPSFPHDGAETLHPMERKHSITALLQHDPVHEDIYMRAQAAARSLLQEHDRQFAITFARTPPTPAEGDLQLLDDVLEGNDAHDLVDLLRRFWDRVREVKGTDQARFWRPTIRTFVSRIPDCLMLPEPRADEPLRTQVVDLELEEHRAAYDQGVQDGKAHRTVDTNPFERGTALARAWGAGWRNVWDSDPEMRAAITGRPVP